MEYFGFCGYWFYAGPSGTAAKIAALFCSWGLLAVAPIADALKIPVMLYQYRKRWS
jgi:hypothetical protein